VVDRAAVVAAGTATAAAAPANVLGARVGAERRRQGRTLKDVSARTGLSISTLSRIENGVLSVTYDNMTRLAAALELELVDLLGQPSDPTPTARRSITRAGSGDVYETDVYRYEMLSTDLARRRMSPMRAVLKSRSIAAFGALKQHRGEEFLHVLAGEIELHTDHYAPARLGPGDSAYFDSSMGHALLAVGKKEAIILWVCAET
jgi:transcriptional regulator with XRE-family HTH domain